MLRSPRAATALRPGCSLSAGGVARLVGQTPSGQHRRKPPTLVAHGYLHRCTPPGSIGWSKRRQVSWLAARRLDPPSRAACPVARNRIAARRLQLRGQRRTGAKARAGFPFKSRRTPSWDWVSWGPGAGKRRAACDARVRTCTPGNSFVQFAHTAAAVGFVSRLPCRMAARVRSCRAPKSFVQQQRHDWTWPIPRAAAPAGDQAASTIC